MKIVQSLGAKKRIAKLYDMLPAEEPGTSEGRTAATNQTVRSVFVVGPDKKIKLRNYMKFKTAEAPKDFQNAIFVRRGSTTGFAGKNDLELMYYDRKNLLPDYRIFSSFPYQTLDLILTETMADYNVFKATISLSLENAGSRPIAIIKFVILLNIKTEPMVEEGEIKLKSSDQYIKQPIILQPGQIVNQSIAFQSKGISNSKFDDAYFSNKRINDHKELLCSSGLELILSNGKHITSDVTITNAK